MTQEEWDNLPRRAEKDVKSLIKSEFEKLGIKVIKVDKSISKDYKLTTYNIDDTKYLKKEIQELIDEIGNVSTVYLYEVKSYYVSKGDSGTTGYDYSVSMDLQ